MPPMLPGEQVIEDYRHLRLSLKAHPVSFLRRDLDARGIVRHELLSTRTPGGIVTIGGIVLVRQRPGTGKAIFMTLEDETGHANVIVMPDVYSLDPMVVLHERFVQVKGRVQNQEGVVHLRAERISPLSVSAAATQSHDFH